MLYIWTTTHLTMATLGYRPAHIMAFTRLTLFALMLASSAFGSLLLRKFISWRCSANWRFMSLQDKNSTTNKLKAKKFKSYSSITYNSRSLVCGTVSTGKTVTTVSRVCSACNYRVKKSKKGAIWIWRCRHYDASEPWLTKRAHYHSYC